MLTKTKFLRSKEAVLLQPKTVPMPPNQSYFVKDGLLHPSATYKRYGVATQMNESGKMSIVAQDTPRYEWKDGKRSLLIESYAYNDVEDSSRFSRFFTLGGSTIYASDGVPDGQAVMPNEHYTIFIPKAPRNSLMPDVNTDNYMYCYANSSVGQTCFSVYVRLPRGATKTTRVCLSIRNNNLTQLKGAYTYKIVPDADWVRVTCNQNVVQSGLAAERYEISSDEAIEVCCAQIERGGAFPTSYVPHYPAGKGLVERVGMRASEYATIPTTVITPTGIRTQGSFVFEGRSDIDRSSGILSYSTMTSTSNAFVLLYTTTNPSRLSWWGSTILTTNNLFNCAFTGSTAGSKLCLNRSDISKSTMSLTFGNDPSWLRIGEPAQDSKFGMNGSVRNIFYYFDLMTDEQLFAATTPV